VAALKVSGGSLKLIWNHSTVEEAKKSSREFPALPNFWCVAAPSAGLREKNQPIEPNAKLGWRGELLGFEG
jgi:hypothetical protein